MAAADVEALCRWMWAHRYPTLPDVAQGLREALDEGAIARVAGASAEQVDVMREIRAAAEAEADSVSEQRIALLDAAVAAAGAGPFYYSVVLMMYGTWAEEYRAYMSSAGPSGPSTPARARARRARGSGRRRRGECGGHAGRMWAGRGREWSC